MFLRLTAALMLLTGCANDCQQVCNEMADWAESECNREFTSEEVSSCISAYKNGEGSDAQLADCAEYKDRIDEEWTCEDIETYFE